jgi:hypothetical protein
MSDCEGAQNSRMLIARPRAPMPKTSSKTAMPDGRFLRAAGNSFAHAINNCLPHVSEPCFRHTEPTETVMTSIRPGANYRAALEQRLQTGDHVAPQLAHIGQSALLRTALGVAILSRNSATGISVPEWRVMAVLGEHSPQSTQEVIARTEMDRVRVSRAARYGSRTGD